MKLEDVEITTSILTGIPYIARFGKNKGKVLEKRDASGEIARAFIKFMGAKKDNKIKFQNGDEYEIIIKKIASGNKEEGELVELW